MRKAEIFNQAAGCIILCTQTKRICLSKRSHHMRYPNMWATWGGNMEPGESPKQTVLREVEEETGFTGIRKLIPLMLYRDKHFAYHNFLALVDNEFSPDLDLYETSSYLWLNWGEWPKPMHPGLVELLKDPESVKTIKQFLS